MCGIAGFVDLRGAHPDVLSTRVRSMTDQLRHRGPDDEGVWIGAESGVALGVRRLAILDLTVEGHQPMASSCGRYVIAFNGEIYNFRALRSELERSGRVFRGHSDTEALVEAISEWGIERALSKANGMFALAVWDRERRTLHLARDRMGEKPLYFARDRDRLLFASELKAIRAHPLFQAEIDRNALALLLRHQYVPAPHSIYRGVAKLRPGTLVTLTHDLRMSEIEYWSFDRLVAGAIGEREDGVEADLVDELESLLRDAVRLRLEADVPVGVFLSGGVDSTTLVALMREIGQDPIKTFTIGFGVSGYDETLGARAIARHLQTDHTEEYVSARDALALVPRLPEIWDEPFADASQLPTALLCALARRHVTVALSGDGGDELFGGYTHYVRIPHIWHTMGLLPVSLRRAASYGFAGAAAAATGTPIRVVGGATRRRFADRAAKLGGLLRTQQPTRMPPILLSPWPEESLPVLGAFEPRTALTDPSLHPPLERLTDRMMYADTVTLLAEGILTKVDRASMSVSLESRAPFLDPRVVEFAWRLPAHQRIRGQTGKWILRRVLERHVPARLWDRPKSGFRAPIHEWLRGPLRDWAEALLDERLLRDQGYFNPAPIRRRWLEHVSGARDWQYALWTVLSFQAWFAATHGNGAAVAQGAPQTPVARCHRRSPTEA
jgi:asparagine synthase (glutamine-hydrolysing)